MLSNEPEESYEGEMPNRVAEEYNGTVPQAAPHFTKPTNMHPAEAKPAGNMLRLKSSRES